MDRLRAERMDASPRRHHRLIDSNRIRCNRYPEACAYVERAIRRQVATAGQPSSSRERDRADHERVNRLVVADDGRHGPAEALDLQAQCLNSPPRVDLGHGRDDAA